VTRTTNGAPNAIAEDADAAASPDDSDLDEKAESHAELLARHLGAEIIAQEDHGA
jgi:DNA polymerase III subunit gamma/tau